MQNNLSNYSTAEIVKELQIREAVKTIYVQPHEKYQISVDGYRINNTGPVILLTVID